MEYLTDHLKNITKNGFTVFENVYTKHEVEAIIADIEQIDQNSSKFRKTNDLFAIRQFLKEVPAIKELVFSDRLKQLISDIFGGDYFVVKSIYFDKPESSNWFVAWHQDLTIAVDRKVELPGFVNWTKKLDAFAVQPPLPILQDNFTVRIHLDDTNENNGALKVVPASHKKGIYRPEQIEAERSCSVKAGGIMFMRPLLMHSSDRSTGNRKRRVIHIEFSRVELPCEINWAEKEYYQIIDNSTQPCASH